MAQAKIDLTLVAEWASVVGLLGVIATFIQLLRTQGSVKAARAAIDRTEKHLALNQVLVLLPQLQKLEGDLDVAVSAGAREAVIRHLVEWRRLASEVAGLIEAQAYADPTRVDQLQASAVTAAVTKSQLTGTARDIVSGTKTVRAEIATACEYAGTLSGRLRAYSGAKQ